MTKSLVPGHSTLPVSIAGVQLFTTISV